MNQPTANQTPEQQARDKIDRRLLMSGWLVQDKHNINLSVGRGIAVREYQTEVGPADYVLFVDRQAMGVIEAKPDSWGHRITTVELQSQEYASARLKWINNEQPLPFVYESTGVVTRFTNAYDPDPRSREVFSFHQPATLATWHAQNLNQSHNNAGTLRARLQQMPPLITDGLRECQITAITRLEHSFQQDRPRALVQMATGSGKTFTAITASYRLLKHAGARRILFLVDTLNLGEQAEQEFMAYLPNDDNRKFTELYNVQRLKSSAMASDTQVIICTIQRMYSLLKGEELDITAEESPASAALLQKKEPLPVIYNNKIPPEFFDFIIIDECHRSIYRLWRQVIEYFDAYLIGLTATPDQRTYGFFNTNVVSEYDHEQAVADGVNVGNEIYLIETERTQQGGKIAAQQQVERRERLTRKRRWQLQDEDEDYTPNQLDRDVVNPDQIRTVIRTFRDKLPDIFPGRREVPKTLIFAKTDSHADDIINIVREEFGKGNQFCKKITYRIEEDPKSALAQFRNDYDPRIAVTVDMIATGTDVKPLECLLFMRDVRSRNYFEQMKGRGTRTLDADSLKKVTPSATTAKTHYVIVDAIGVTRSLKTASQPLITRPGISLKDLAMGVMLGAARDEDSVSSLAGRLARLDRQLDDHDRQRIAQLAGKPLHAIVGDLLGAINPDNIEQKALAIAGQPAVTDPGDSARNQAREQLVGAAASVFTGEFVQLIDSIRRDKEQTIVHEDPDRLTRAEWAGDTDANARLLSQEFADYLQEHRDNIEALSIYFLTPARRSEVNYTMIRDLLERLQRDRPKLAPLRVWQAYAHLDAYRGSNPASDLTALVALIRRVTGLDQTLTRHSERVRRNFQNWVLNRHSGAGEKFTEEQMDWLRMIRDHLATSFTIERDDLERTPFDGKGGMGQMYALFGDGMDEVMAEMNEALSA